MAVSSPTSDQAECSADRRAMLRRGILLECVVIVWNVAEGVIAVVAGLLAGSVALFSFGVDSIVEVTSAAVVLWRLRLELHGDNSERAERVDRSSARIAGVLLLILAMYMVIDAGRRLLGAGEAAESSYVGIALTALSLVVMPLLAWAKLSTAKDLRSGALRADAMETMACAWLSLATLVGLTLNAWLGWHWADPAAALLIVPLVVREGIEALQGRHCGGCC